MAQRLSSIINGERFYPCPTLTDTKTEAVDDWAPRTWSERFFSLPWRPWVALKPIVRYVTTEVPSRQVIRTGAGFYAHPDLIAEIKAAFDKVNE